MSINLTALKEKMAALPHKEQVANQSLKSKIMQLRPQIRELHIKKLWSWEEIAEFLTSEGIGIKPSTLKLYYHKSSPRKPKDAEQKAADRATRETRPDAPPPPPSATAAKPAWKGTVNPVLEDE